MYIAPPDHYLVEWDLSQAETWVTAYLAREPKMKQFLKESDIHTETASAIYHKQKQDVTPVERYLGKKGNHSLSYGSTHYMLTQSINAESDNPPYVTVTITESKKIYDGWHMLYTRIKEWQAELQEQARYTRKLITPHGRERTFFAEWGPELWKEMYANIPQSTVADHLNGMEQDEIKATGGLLTVRRKFPDIKIVSQRHDSFMVEMKKDSISMIPEITNLIRRPMVINGEEFTIPVDCKYGERDGELEKVKS